MCVKGGSDVELLHPQRPWHRADCWNIADLAGLRVLREQALKMEESLCGQDHHVVVLFAQALLDLQSSLLKNWLPSDW